MNTWILLFLVAVGHGVASFQVEGFESKAECERAAAVASSAMGSRLWGDVSRYACIERKAAR